MYTKQQALWDAFLEDWEAYLKSIKYDSQNT